MENRELLAYDQRELLVLEEGIIRQPETMSTLR